uniref:Uncharacterized protein n=1 Tax=Anguilla anguilla TaxID=7936 RepID=A0A0E9S6N8_ANGAN
MAPYFLNSALLFCQAFCNVFHPGRNTGSH